MSFHLKTNSLQCKSSADYVPRVLERQQHVRRHGPTDATRNATGQQPFFKLLGSDLRRLNPSVGGGPLVARPLNRVSCPLRRSSPKPEQVPFDETWILICKTHDDVCLVSSLVDWCASLRSSPGEETWRNFSGDPWWACISRLSWGSSY